MTPARAPRIAAVATLLLLGLGLSACAGSDDSGSSADSGAAPAAAMPEGGTDLDRSSGDGARAEAEAPADAPLADMAALDEGAAYDAQTTSGSTGSAPQEQQPEEPGDSRALIKRGNVALRADDVGNVLNKVRGVVSGAGGEVAEDRTEADDDGEAKRAFLTVRVPVDSFEAVLDELKGADGAELIDSSSTTEDVTTAVIDNDVRVQLQRRSLERISILLDQARSIRDIVSIERELARREADLGSLEKRQAFLADQTSMGTISISIERPPAEKEKQVVKKKEKDETGFVAGLKGGWDAFTSVTTGLLTATGAVLPFALLGLLVGVPLWIFLRRRTPATHPAAATADATP